ncbi:MAG: DUF2304 domain-containing protein [Candidatus Nanopelagicales bacterium]
MARLLFIAMVVAVVAVVWRARHSAGGKAGNRLLLVGFAGVVVFTIVFPETTSVAAGWLGIGRGADLVFYLTSFAVMFLAASMYLKSRWLEDRIAALTSSLALREWEAERRAVPDTSAATQERQQAPGPQPTSPQPTSPQPAAETVA